LEYGNPTQQQRGRDKKLTYGDGGTCTHVPPPCCLRPWQTALHITQAADGTFIWPGFFVFFLSMAVSV